MTLEGVSYYIPRESVASTIKAMGEVRLELSDNMSSISI